VAKAAGVGDVASGVSLPLATLLSAPPRTADPASQLTAWSHEVVAGGETGRWLAACSAVRAVTIELAKWCRLTSSVTLAEAPSTASPLLEAAAAAEAAAWDGPQTAAPPPALAFPVLMTGVKLAKVDAALLQAANNALAAQGERWPSVPWLPSVIGGLMITTTPPRALPAEPGTVSPPVMQWLASRLRPAAVASPTDESVARQHAPSGVPVSGAAARRAARGAAAAAVVPDAADMSMLTACARAIIDAERELVADGRVSEGTAAVLARLLATNPRAATHALLNMTLPEAAAARPPVHVERAIAQMPFDASATIFPAPPADSDDAGSIQASEATFGRLIRGLIAAKLKAKRLAGGGGGGGGSVDGGGARLPRNGRADPGAWSHAGGRRHLSTAVVQAPGDLDAASRLTDGGEVDETVVDVAGTAEDESRIISSASRMRRCGFHNVRTVRPPPPTAAGGAGSAVSGVDGSDSEGFVVRATTRWTVESEGETGTESEGDGGAAGSRTPLQAGHGALAIARAMAAGFATSSGAGDVALAARSLSAWLLCHEDHPLRRPAVMTLASTLTAAADVAAGREAGASGGEFGAVDRAAAWMAGALLAQGCRADGSLGAATVGDAACTRADAVLRRALQLLHCVVGVPAVE